MFIIRKENKYYNGKKFIKDRKAARKFKTREDVVMAFTNLSVSNKGLEIIKIGA